MTVQWFKVSVAARYCGVSVRTLRTWIAREHIKYSRLPTGLILIKSEWLDSYLEGFAHPHKDLLTEVEKMLNSF